MSTWELHQADAVWAYRGEIIWSFGLGHPRTAAAQHAKRYIGLHTITAATNSATNKPNRTCPVDEPPL